MVLLGLQLANINTSQVRGGDTSMADGQRSNQVLVPQARQSLDNLKNQIASQIGVNLQGYAGDIATRDAGKVGGQMVKFMIQQAEQQLGGAGAAGGGFAAPARPTTTR